MKRLPKMIMKELDGCAWRIENGGRHLKIFVDNRLVAVIPMDGRGHEMGRSTLNVRSQIRRAKCQRAT